MNEPKPFVGRVLIVAAAFVILVAGMRTAESILVPFLLSIFIAIISAPPLFWLESKRVPAALALTIVVTGVVGVIIGTGALVGTSLDGFSNDLPSYETKLKDYAVGFSGWLTEKGIAISEDHLLKYVHPGAAMNLVTTLLNGLGSALANSFLIFLTVIFILLEASSFSAKLQTILSNPETSLIHFNTFFTNVKRYVAIKTTTSLITGAAIGVWLMIIGVDYPLLWGFLAFLLNFIPNIGSIIAAVPTILLTLVQLGPGAVLLVAAGYLVVNNIVGNVIEPKFMGQGLGLSTLVVFLSLVFWGWVLGPVGMFLSVPLTMTVKIALDSSDETKWIALMLGSEAKSTPEDNGQAPKKRSGTVNSKGDEQPKRAHRLGTDDSATRLPCNE